MVDKETPPSDPAISPPPPPPAPAMVDADSEPSIHPSFQCCICLDLLYKPVVLACGHMSCFWCVHKAMQGFQASQCPICRNPYYHFPSICQLLHFLLLKIEPLAYKKREVETLEEEKHMDCFSPQFLEHVSFERVRLEDVKESSRSPKSNDYPETAFKSATGKQVSKDDVICPICKKLLFQPVVLNCGHVYCDSCLSGLVDESLKCEVCHSLHPKGFRNVCLDLDHFLEEQFPRDYMTRRESVQLKKARAPKGEASSSVSQVEEPKVGKYGNSMYIEYFFDGDSANVHVGVGCDSCGMYPIIGNRYRCKDCKEKIGYDLCETCYSSSSELAGRFNQQHRPDHTFELDDSHKIEIHKSGTVR